MAKRRRDTIDQLALAVLNRRLGAIARSQDPPFIAAGALHGDELRAEETTSVVVDVQPGHWQQGLTSAETEVRRAVQYGVRPDELEREVTEMRAGLKVAAAGARRARPPQWPTRSPEPATTGWIPWIAEQSPPGSAFWASAFATQRTAPSSGIICRWMNIRRLWLYRVLD